jgi:hypothetical protein
MIDYISLLPAIQAAFARQNITITVPQLFSIAEEILLLTKPVQSSPVPPETPLPVIPIPPVVIPPVIQNTPYTHDQIVSFYVKYLGRQPENEAIIEEWMANPNAEINISQTPEANAYAASQNVGKVQFDHPWTGDIESHLRTILATGLAGSDGSNGQAVIDQMNALGAPYNTGEFVAHHNGPAGLPTYGFPNFYVSYLPEKVYQIVER